MKIGCYSCIRARALHYATKPSAHRSVSHFKVPPNHTIQPFRSYCQVPMSEAQYELLCAETLDAIADKFEDLAEESFTSEEFDVNFASGVITIKLGDIKGTYVINKQTPNKQIWLSSPTSGPKRYDFVEGGWIYKHDGMSLHSLLSEELSLLYQHHIDFTQLPHASKS